MSNVVRFRRRKPRVISDYDPHVPPLWQMALLLQRHWQSLNAIEQSVARHAGQIMMLGDRASPKLQIEYMKYCMAILRRRELLVPIDVQVIL